MIGWNSYVEERMHDMMREAQSRHLLKEAMAQAKETGARRSVREALGERLILLGWRLMNRLPQEGETCSRLVLSGTKQALVMVEVCV